MTSTRQPQVAQLSRSNPPPTAQALGEIIDSDAVTLLVARNQTGVVGVLALVMFPIPTGVRTWIENVIVDENARGVGIGRLLNETAIRHAKAAGAVSVDLTSRPAREQANRLYQEMGFQKRDTNVYRFVP